MLFILSFYVPVLGDIGKLALTLLILLILLDSIVLFARNNGIQGKREMADRFSNGDQNPVTLEIKNQYPFNTSIEIVDELPFQFQLRDKRQQAILKGGETKEFQYSLHPLERGEYKFGNINIFVSSPLALVERRFILEAERMIPVFPSFLQMKKQQLQAASGRMNTTGTYRLKKLGSSIEFEQIKDYVPGDDFRNVNWKATARRGQLMVNNYADEKSQLIYCLIDKGRNMKMPFEGMTLLDYAINASLVLTNVALMRQDKAGLVTFSNKIGTFLPADRKGTQMETILESLYNEQTQFLETDYENLYAHVRNKIKNRSLMVLFTNFESIPGFQRQLPYLRQISRHHLLLVVFFENTELRSLREKTAGNLEEIYIKTIADKFAFEKRLIVKELQQHGILTLLTSPQNVTVGAINKYLELKSRHAI